MRGPNLATLGPLHTTSTASCVQPLLGPLPIGPVRSRGSTRSLGSARSGEPCSLPDGKMSNLANRANRLGSATVKAKYSLGCVLRADPMAPERMGGVGASLGSIEYKNSMPSPREGPRAGDSFRRDRDFRYFLPGNFGSDAQARCSERETTMTSVGESYCTSTHRHENRIRILRSTPRAAGATPAGARARPATFVYRPEIGSGTTVVRGKGR